MRSLRSFAHTRFQERQVKAIDIVYRELVEGEQDRTRDNPIPWESHCGWLAVFSRSRLRGSFGPAEGGRGLASS
jgi:hypothetical protein